VAGDSNLENGDGAINHNVNANPAEPRRRRFGKWIAGVAATVVAAIAVAIFVPYATSVGNRVSDSLNRPGQPAGPAVKIALVDEGPAEGETRATSNPLALSASQLASLNSLAEKASLDSLAGKDSPEYQNWFTNRGAIPVGSTAIRLVVQGNRNNSVRIVNMQPIMSCRAPLTGTLFYFPHQGEDVTTQLVLNLDKPFALPGYRIGVARVNPNYFAHYTVSLKRNEQFTFNIVASTNAYYCEFKLKMTVLDGSRALTETISDNGQPFRVTAAAYKEDNYNADRFAHYQDLYIWGVMAHKEVIWVRANPASFRF
jgi:hypothetical protein